jgi:hypothetical protein
MSRRAAVLAAAFPVLAALAAKLGFLVEAAGTAHLIDDPMITLRVARNVWEHGVPYFNPGEAVAANTSLFWPILLAPAFGVWEDGAAVHALFLGSTLLWTGLACWLGARQPEPVTGLATAVFVALGPWALFYGGSAWEHVPQAVCVAAGFSIWLHGRGGAGPALACFWLLAASFLFRPDSAALVAGFWLAQIAMLRGEERRRFLAASLPALALPALYLAGMLWFYGDVVPNTYYLKSATLGENLANGLAYLLEPRESGPVPILALVLVSLAPWLGARERVVTALIALQVCIVVALGGDIFPQGRFLLLVLPTAAALAFRHLAALIGPGPVALLAVAGATWTLFDPATRKGEARLAAQLASQMTLLESVAPVLEPADGSLGLHFLGLGYHMPRTHVVDFLGKADPVIARTDPIEGKIGHDKWDYDHSLGAHDVALMPVHATAHRWVTGDEEPPPGRGWPDYVRAVLATGRYAYLPPERFCAPTAFGLYLRKDLLARLEAAERRGEDGTPCLGPPRESG